MLYYSVPNANGFPMGFLNIFAAFCNLFVILLFGTRFCGVRSKSFVCESQPQNSTHLIKLTTRTNNVSSIKSIICFVVGWFKLFIFLIWEYF